MRKRNMRGEGEHDENGANTGGIRTPNGATKHMSRDGRELCHSSIRIGNTRACTNGHHEPPAEVNTTDLTDGRCSTHPLGQRSTFRIHITWVKALAAAEMLSCRASIRLIVAVSAKMINERIAIDVLCAVRWTITDIWDQTTSGPGNAKMEEGGKPKELRGAHFGESSLDRRGRRGPVSSGHANADAAIITRRRTGMVGYARRYLRRPVRTVPPSPARAAA